MLKFRNPRQHIVSHETICFERRDAPLFHDLNQLIPIFAGQPPARSNAVLVIDPIRGHTGDSAGCCFYQSLPVWKAGVLRD